MHIIIEGEAKKQNNFLIYLFSCVNDSIVSCAFTKEIFEETRKTLPGVVVGSCILLGGFFYTIGKINLNTNLAALSYTLCSIMDMI